MDKLKIFKFCSWLILFLFFQFSLFALPIRTIYKSICQPKEISFLKDNQLQAFTLKVISDTEITANGIVCSGSLSIFKQLIREYPNIKVIKMGVIYGSIDDEVNLKLGLRIHQLKLTTELSSDSIVASGGTDLFLAGYKRIIKKGAKIGVHSWSEGIDDKAISGKALPVDDKAHKRYLHYYSKIDITPDFYWFTLHAKPNGNAMAIEEGDDMHWMNEKEINQFGMSN